MASDTSTAAQEAQYAVYRRMAPAERVRVAERMCEDARRVSMAGLRARHPDLTEAELQEKQLRALVGDDVYVRIRQHERR